MGDHRLTINIKCVFHGKTYELDHWMNYDGFSGVDRRIIEFFEEMWDDGYRRWTDEMHQLDLERRRDEIEAAERAELDRLKAKYECPP